MCCGSTASTRSQTWRAFSSACDARPLPARAASARFCASCAARSTSGSRAAFSSSRSAIAEQRVDELVLLAEPRVQLLEPGEVAGRRVELAQRAQRLRVVRLELEDLLPRRRGLLRRAEPVGVDLAELLEQRDRFLAACARERDLAMQDLGEREVALLAIVERRERGERVGDVVRRPRRARVL